MVFSDMLGNNQLYTQLALNGEILDFGGQITYLNRTNRLAYGVGVSHIPLRTGFQQLFAGDFELPQGGGTFRGFKRETNIIRIFDETVSGFVQYPFSTTLRLEGGINGTYRSFRQDQYDEYFDQFSQFIYEERNRVETGDQIDLNQFYTIEKGTGASANIALVGDNSYFGLTSPLAGYRYRLSVERAIGNNDYTGILADYRRYFWLRPVSLAVRGTSYLRFENQSNTLFPFYIGQMGFVRGYGSVFGDNIQEMGLNFGQLIGSKMGIASFEVRLPFIGPRQLALIGSNTFFADLALFVDSGVAFDSFDSFDGGPEQNPATKPAIVSSAGVAMRVNLFGALILEPYIAWPLRENGVRSFGLNFIPGW